MGWGNVWEWVKWLVFVGDEVGQSLRASQSGCSVVWRIVGTVGLMGLEVCVCFISGHPLECVQTDL